MAVIGKIRERGMLIATVVFVSLGLFVLGDVWKSNGSGNMRGDQAVAEINGREISAMEFSTRTEEQANLYRENGTTVDDQLNEQIRNSVWQELLKESTLKVQSEKAGFGTTLCKEEYDDIRWGENIVPDFKDNQNFKDPQTGQLDKARLKNYFAAIQEKAPVLYDYQKRTFIPNRIYAKYNALAKKACFVNSAQVKEEYAAKNTKATFNFVAQRYTSVPDSLHPATDEAVRRYFDAHRSEKKWHQKASRSFVYVRVGATATQEDIAAGRDAALVLKPQFEAAAGTADSVFVMANAETKNGKAAAYTPGSADALNDSLIANAPVGTVVGPYKDGEFWKLVKVKELADVPEARVRHILLKSDASDDAVKKQRADSILAAVKRDKSKFEALVTKYTDDPGSKSTGGVYEWFDKTKMVPEFTKASFDENVGAITICKTTYGYHIVEVLGKRNRSERRVLTVDQRIRPDKAMKAAWTTASTFSLNNLDSASFRRAADTLGLAYTPVDELRADQPYVPGLQDPAQVASWVNRAAPSSKPSEPIANGEGYVVALLTGIREEGLPEFAGVKEAMSREVLKENKAEALLTQFAGKTDLNTLATEIGSTVQNAADMAFNAPSIPGGFSDQDVIGQIFALKNGEVSKPLKGDQAVYVVNVTNVTPATEMPANGEDPKPLADKVRNRAEGQLFNALKEAANVKDERSKFF
jgi:peptidyl-prolyl cis-trans isomerase D